MPPWSLLSLLAVAIAACSTDRECSVPADCDDADLCTEERCRLGKCSHLVITHCCSEHRPCLDSERPACDSDAGRCVECLNNDDCTDPSLPVCNPSPIPHCAQCRLPADCALGEICNRGQCAPAPPGAPCTRDDQCPSHWCLRERDTGFPGGFCGQACNESDDCATGACVDVSTGGKTCLGPCVLPPSCPQEPCPPDCRPEYACVPSGKTTACVPYCTDAAHCPEVGTCDPWSGMCTTVPPIGGLNGTPCVHDADCRGICVTEGMTGAPGGICASSCANTRRQCPGDDACVYLLGPWVEAALLCLPEFVEAEGCRPAYAPQIAALLPVDNPEWDATTVCLPACQDSDCVSGVCNEYSGLCNGEPDPGAGDFGDPCQTHAECKGMCMSFWPSGYCMGPCIVGGPACPDGAVCMNLGVLTSCGHPCATSNECREPDYSCNPMIQACLPP